MSDPSPQAPNRERAQYDLHHALDGTSYPVRENLEDILRRELLGPIHGDNEVLPFSPRAQYLVGMIAPVKLTGIDTGHDAEEAPDEDDDRTALAEIGTDATGGNGRGVPVAGADDIEAAADAEDDDTEDRVPKKGLMLSASMGLRFQVPIDLESFRVTGSWGRYESFETDKVAKSGRPIRNFQRTPVEITRTIRLGDLTIGHTTTVVLEDDVCLRIDRYDDSAYGRVLIEIALCNDRETPTPIPLDMWLFQTSVRVDAGGTEAFLPVRDLLEHDWYEHDDEVRRLDLQYRDRLEYAIGRTCSADWVVRDGSRRATEVSTTWLPVAETPQTRARTVEDALLSMDTLADVDADRLRRGLEPLVTGYRAWIDQQRVIRSTLPERLHGTVDEALYEAGEAADRLAAGIDHIASEPEALQCFRFMNRVMRDQRIASQVAALRAADENLSVQDARRQVADLGEVAASWRPFQLAFILMQLPSLTDPAATPRSADKLAHVELLFFPTGGGKTEAYLGLAAYTFAIRRRQGIVDSTEGSLDGRDGVAVLMRYTLRLLTAQQFQRATTLMCAAELARREDETTWGTEPFRIGLWVGTAVSPKRFEEAEEQLFDANEYGAAYNLTVKQLHRCPWCGTPIKTGGIKADKTLRRIFVYCGDDLGDCPFSRGGRDAHGAELDEGLPILTVDEEIYRLTPAFVIATVDKFARLAREGEAASLFGYVSRRCERHGYVHPDSRCCGTSKHGPPTSHNAKDGHPTAAVRTVGRLRPPDLIIQDELHLITGALGTAVGLFEVAIETLASWEKPDETPVRPLIVAATATVRNAEGQIRALYGRQVNLFPPQVLDVADTYFSYEVPVDRDHPGRRYLGISATGVRLSSAEIRIAEVLLSAGQLLYNRAGDAADPYMTLVGYFNATRELAGMSRYMDDDVATRIKRPRNDSGFPPRTGTAYGQLNVGELTARIASDEIGRTLDRLALPFDTDFDTTEAIKGHIADRRADKDVPTRDELPFDVVLATSMLQVGVDVQRLGLMLVVGQPKNTAEYIQASSRVGRSGDRPGIVVSLGNWARPRDLAHFEQFRHYHETFYSQVEALSVTPFSPTSLERGIDGLLVSAARVAQATDSEGLSPELDAWRIRDQHAAVVALTKRLEKRIAAAAQSESAAKLATSLLANRVDRWSNRGEYAVKLNQTLAYERTGKGDTYLPLLTGPENAEAASGAAYQPPFVVANSMREVQPSINLLVSPVKERLVTVEPDGVPQWTMPTGSSD